MIIPDYIEAEAQTLVSGWRRHFKEHDLNLNWTAVEQAKMLQLNDKLLLVGIVDGEGDGFFAEFKTANPRTAKTWKKEWVLNPQALTYGLLTGGTKRYLVRKAFKLAVPEYDHEWFEFGPADLSFWRQQVIEIGHDIEALANRQPWPLNLAHGCFAYGQKYPCPFWSSGCSKLTFNGPVSGEVPSEIFPEFQGPNRAILTEALKMNPDAITLSATRIADWMRCREMFRRKHIEGVTMPPSDAMLLGSRFHELVAMHNRSYIKVPTGDA